MGNVISDLAEGASKGLFSGLGSLAKDIRTAITGVDPDKAAAIEEKLLELEAAADQAQNEINKVEAANPSLFVSGWRPAVGWICVFALGWYYILAPSLTWIMSAFKIEMGIPQFDTGELISLLFGMLGMSGLRTYEKKMGRASK